ncbi:MAG TPA: putative S-layer protein [Candidatus Nanoarchaeia archaeon]|nr:putative S-layer protein [Candidatus Nanoarchaeia archaeon]
MATGLGGLAQMNKIFPLVLTFLILNIFLVLAVPPTITPTTVDIVGTNGDIVSKTFNVTNNQAGTVTFTFNASAADLKDNDNDEITLNFTGGSSIASGATATITATANIASLMDFDMFGGSVSVSDGTESSTFTLNIDVQPEVCDSGIAGNDLKITINKPDSGDDFKPGEEIEVEVDVENKGTDDIDVQVEAFLINDDDEVASGSSDVININDGDEEEFTTTLTVPLDSDSIGGNKDLKLYVKAFDDDAEDENCIQASVDVNIDTNDNEVVFDEKLSKFSPSIASCGDTVFAFVEFVNIGEDDQNDVFATLRNKNLGFDERSSDFDLDDFDSEDRNRGSARFSVDIPEGASEGKYIFIAELNSDGPESSMEMSLEVICSDGSSGTGMISDTSTVLELLDDSLVLEKGMPALIPVRINNNEDNPIVFYAELRNVEDFSNSVSSKQITVPGQRSATIFLPLEAKSDADAGRYSATVVLRTPTQTIGSETFVVDVVEEGNRGITSGSDTEYGSVLVWALFIVMLVVLIALVSAALMKKKQ